MQVDDDPLKKDDSMYAEIIGINMVDISEVAATGIPIEASMPEAKVLVDAKMVTEDQFAEKMIVAYPRAEEDLIDFLNKCKISNTNAMLCPRCIAIFDKDAAKSVEGFQPQSKRKGGWAENHQ